MKLNQIAFAAAAMAAGMAQAAPVTPDLVIKLDGATAVAQSVTDVAAFLCKDGPTGPTTKYMSNASAKVSAVYCSAGVKADSGLATATKVLVMKNNKDGSLETFDRALSRKAKTTLLKVAGLDDTCGTTCATEPVNADGGFSDVDPNIWAARIDNNTYMPQFDPALVSGGYTVKSGFAGQGFGIAVSKALYDALQAAQKVLNPADDGPGVNQPNITRQEFTSILSATGGYHTDWQPLLGAAGAGKNVHLCRRTNASGTQASMDSFFLENPCTLNNDPTYGSLEPAYASDSTGTFIVTENPGTGDVKTCLTTPNYAIGVMSLENADAAGYKYVKLDGVSPNEEADRRKSVVEGRYNFAEEMVLAYRNDSSPNAKTYLNNFAKIMGDPSKVAALNGVYVVPNGAFTYDATKAAYPFRVHKGTRFGNACQPFQLSNKKP